MYLPAWETLGWEPPLHHPSPTATPIASHRAVAEPSLEVGLARSVSDLAYCQGSSVGSSSGVRFFFSLVIGVERFARSI